MKSIHTLIPDIYSTVQRKDGWFTEAIADQFSTSLSKTLQSSMSQERERRGLRLSQMGSQCPRALWYSIHHPELAEKIPPWVEVKFSYGHILEALAIALAKSAGHEVVGEQDEIILDGVTGHRDCIIDGCIVDVKSASSLSFEKFKNGTIGQSDSFGYLDQLDGYLVGSLEDPLVRVKDKAYLFAIDKTLGHMCLYEHTVREEHIRARVASYKNIVALSTPPKCECGTTKDGESGNFKLDTRASYNPFKYQCFPHLRTFLYSGGPRYLTRVVRLPNVTEIDKDGKVIYKP